MTETLRVVAFSSVDRSLLVQDLTCTLVQLGAVSSDYQEAMEQIRAGRVQEATACLGRPAGCDSGWIAGTTNSDIRLRLFENVEDLANQIRIFPKSSIRELYVVDHGSRYSQKLGSDRLAAYGGLEAIIIALLFAGVIPYLTGDCIVHLLGCAIVGTDGKGLDVFSNMVGGRRVRSCDANQKVGSPLTQTYLGPEGTVWEARGPRVRRLGRKELTQLHLALP